MSPRRSQRSAFASPHAPASDWRLCWLAPLLLAALGIAPYLPLLSAGFLWDDYPAIHENYFLRNAAGLWRIWTSHGLIPNESHYWPMVYSTFWLEFQLWGEWAAGFHAVNMLLHAVNTALVWAVLRRLGLSPLGAGIAGALFAVHPIHVESVAWIIERKDVLSGFFYLLAAWSWLNWRDGRTGVWLAGATGGLAAAMLSKTIAISLPLALLVAVWLREGRVARRDWLGLTPLFLVAATLGAVDVALARRLEGVDFGHSPLEKALLATRALWFYAGKIVWPHPLVHIYPRWTLAANDVIAWLGLAGAVAVPGLLWLGRGVIGRAPVAAAVYFGITLAPVLGLVDFTFMEHSFVADRFVYLASIGPLALAGAAVQALANRRQSSRLAIGIMAGTGAAILAILCVLTWRQASLYINNKTLFVHVLAHNPNSHAAFNNLGHTHLAQGNLAVAEPMLRRALELKPDYTEALNNLGVLAVRQGRWSEAARHYQTALNHGAPWSSTRNDLAWILATAPDEAVRRPEQAIKLAAEACAKTDRRHPAMLDTLAAAFASAGRFDEAIKAADEALQLARALEQKPLAAEIEGRLRLYRSGQAFLMPDTPTAP